MYTIFPWLRKSFIFLFSAVKKNQNIINVKIYSIMYKNYSRYT